MSEMAPRILKANAARDLPQRVAFNFEDLREQAAAELQRARAEAAALVDKARQEAAALKQKLLEDARTEGRQSGLSDAEQQIAQRVAAQVEQRLAEHLQTTLPAVSEVALALQGERDRWLLHWERSAVSLGVAIAEKLLKTQLTANPELTTGLLTEALNLAAGQPQLQIHLHPADLARLGSHAADLVKSITACADPKFLADPAISPGGCLIETQHGSIDARLESMLERITEELLAH